VLEHLGYQSHLPRALREFCRVLRPGGAARISVPDFEVLCRQFLDPRATPEERFHCMRMAFGGQIDAYDFHHVGLTHEFLGRYLYEAGFSRVERVKRFGLFNDASELVVRGELISLNVVAYK
jgi:predicted SAM-dependent methyltransferase